MIGHVNRAAKELVSTDSSVLINEGAERIDVSAKSEWGLLGKAETEKKVGSFYNWYAASNPLLAPIGWHVPTDQETIDLHTYLHANGYDYFNMHDYLAKSLADDSGWNIGTDVFGSPAYFQDQNNSSGFALRCYGERNYLGEYSMVGGYGCLWTSTEVNVSYARDIYISANSPYFYTGASMNLKKSGKGIRPIKDTSDWFAGETVTDIDGNVYQTVKIGNQVWMSENLNVEHYNDGTFIPNLEENAAWTADLLGARCIYDNNPTLIKLIQTPTTLKIKSGEGLEIAAGDNIVLSLIGNVLTVSEKTIIATANVFSIGWNLVGGYYEYTIHKAEIKSTSSVDIIPVNAAYDIVAAAAILPQTDSHAGSVTIYAKNAPTDNFIVTLHIR